MSAAKPGYAVAGILGLTFVGLCLFDLAAGLAAFAVLTVAESLSLLTGSPAIKLAGFVLLAVTISRGKALTLLQERVGVALAAGFFVTWAAASSIWASDTSVALGSASRFALDAALLFVVYAAVREPRHVRWLVYSFVGGATLMSLYGALRVGAGHEVNDVTGDPNYFASILVSALALTAFALVGSRDSRTRLLMATALVFIGTALFLTGSRGGLVALAALLVTAVLIGGEFRRHLAAAVVGIVLIGIGYYVFVAPPALVQHVTHFTSGGGAGRQDLWKVAATVAGHEPALGVGAGNFQVVEPVYAAATINLRDVQQIVGTPNVVHNTYLSLLAELGVPGLLAFLLVAGAGVESAARSIRIAHAAGDGELEYLCRGTLVALLTLFTAFFFLTGEYQKYLWLFFGLAIALPSVAERARRARAEALAHSENADW